MADHESNGQIYHNIFVARDAVTYLVISGYAPTRDQAVLLGRKLVNECHLFEHAGAAGMKEEFADDFLLFRFAKKNERTILINIHDYSPDELAQVAIKFERSVVVKTHIYHLMIYANTFVGSDAVDFLVRSNIAGNRQHAVEIGNKMMMTFKLFRHVTDNHDFQDDRLFYRFTPVAERHSLSYATSILREETWDTERKLTAAAESLRRGVLVKNYKCRGKLYRQTFQGSVAVDFMVNSSLASSRRQAVRLGRRMERELNLFSCPLSNTLFQDDIMVYRFNDDKMSYPSLRCTDVVDIETSSLKSASMEQVAEVFRKGVKVGDNRYHLKVYKDTFVGNEAVDFLVASQLADSRTAAVDLGRSLKGSSRFLSTLSENMSFPTSFSFTVF